MPKTLIHYCKILFALFIIIGAPTQSIYAQKTTTIIGKVFDARTKEPLPFVDVILKGTYVGASTDLDGKYEIKTKFASDTIMVSFLGYQTQEQAIVQEDRQVLDFYLEEEGILMESVTIVEKKGRYRKKNNPAVELMRKVIENRDRNKLEAQDYYKMQT